MTRHHNEPAGHHARQPWHRNLHKDWRSWVVVGLMLAAMAAYIMSLDEEIKPGGKANGQRVPAAAE
jgi:hypothetical protein